MSKKLRRTAAGLAIVLAVAVFHGNPAIAQGIYKTIDVLYRDIKIYVDGNITIPKDASGRVVEPFIYNGTVYLPARALSEALGKTVEWDDAANSVYIGESVSQDIIEITVGTAEELVAALGSNRRILLKEGVYNLTGVSPGYVNNTSVYFRENFDGPDLLLDGIHNLTIQGVGDGQSEIIVEPRYSFVMNFKNCSNINIVNIKAGHTEGGYCSGGVFSFENSSGIQIDNTLMYGCGTVGLSLLRVMDMKVTNSTIYECTQGIMYIYGSSDILFKDCVFRDNETYTMVEIGLTSGFTIDSCEFLRNKVMYYPNSMFSISQSENVEVKNTIFADNEADKLIEQDDTEFDTSNIFENNTFGDSLEKGRN